MGGFFDEKRERSSGTIWDRSPRVGRGFFPNVKHSRCEKNRLPMLSISNGACTAWNKIFPGFTSPDAAFPVNFTDRVSTTTCNLREPGVFPTDFLIIHEKLVRGARLIAGIKRKRNDSETKATAML